MRKRIRYAELVEELETILESSSSEEILHQFFSRNPHIFTGSLVKNDRLIKGVLSKFPISPDRIPDFSNFVLYFRMSQYRSTVDLIELKRSSALLFVERGRMSKDLNDAWSECQDSLRILSGLGYMDFLRRAKRALATTLRNEGDSICSVLEEGIATTDAPECTCYIVIGRRASLGDEGIHRVRQLSESTGGRIRVVTYDTILDNMKDRALEEGSTGKDY